MADIQKTAPEAHKKKTKIVIGLLVFFVVIVVAFGSLFGGAVAYGAYANPGDPLLQKLVMMPVLKYAVSAEKRGRVFLNMGLEIIGDSEKRAELMNMPFEFEGRVEVEVKGVRSVGDIKGTLDYSGQKSRESMIISNTLNVDIGGIVGDADAEAYLVGDNLYFRLNSFPEVILGASTYLFGSEMINAPSVDIKDQWFRVDLSSEVDVDLNEADSAEKILEILDEENANFAGLAEVQGRSAFHFSYDVSESDFKDLLNYENEAGEIDIDNVRIEIWFDDAGEVFRFAVFADIKDSGGNRINVSMSYELWNLGAEIELSEPTEHKEWEEFLKEIN